MGGTSRGRTGRAGWKPCVSLPSREEGQALVEFALVAPLFLLLVAGIIQFGVALNFWLDLQRIANQGARWAVVNHYPGCPRNANPDDPGVCDQSLQDYLASSPVAGGLNPDVQICFEEMTGSGIPSKPTVGDPVTVRLRSEFDFVPIIGIGTLDLRGVATMRIEQNPTRYSASGC